MALMWMEGFETFGTTIGSAGSADVAAGMERKYGDLKSVPSNVHNLTDPELAAGRNGGYSLRGKSVSGTQVFSHSVGYGGTPTNDTWIVGMAVKFPSFPNDEKILIVGRNNGNFSLRISSTGQITAMTGFSTVLAETASGVLTAGTWHYIELKVVVHGTTGSYEIRVDGFNVLSDTDVGTRGNVEDSKIVQFRFHVVDQEFDDIYICNIDGTKNNDFLGRVVIEGIFPSAEGDSSDWTPQSGTDNAAMVDDNPADDDATYVETSVEGNEDLYAYDDLATITDENILAVMINTEVRVTESPGDIDIRQQVKSGTTTSDGADVNIDTDSYVHVHRIVENDPDTSAAWTAAGVSGVQFGIKAGA